MQTQHSFLSDWLPHKNTFLQGLYEREAPPTDMECVCGEAGKYRCKDCPYEWMSCKACCLREHRNLHTHRVQQFTGKYFVKRELHYIGHVWYLGHYGSPCHCPLAEEEGAWEDERMVQGEEEGAQVEETYTKILVVDSTGISHHYFHFCTCRNAKSTLEQLVQARLFPASYENVATVFTFQTLDDYLLESTACKMTGNAFWAKIKRRTNNAFPDDVPVCSNISNGCTGTNLGFRIAIGNS